MKRRVPLVIPVDHVDPFDKVDGAKYHDPKWAVAARKVFKRLLRPEKKK